MRPLYEHARSDRRNPVASSTLINTTPPTSALCSWIQRESDRGLAVWSGCVESGRKGRGVHLKSVRVSSFPREQRRRRTSGKQFCDPI